jgi:hypothetical protein
MVRFGLPNSDTALLLTPRWGELPLPLQVLLLATLVLVPVVLVLSLYRYELKLVSGWTATFLLALRLTAVLLAIILVGFQPILGRDWTEKLPARVLVAVDRSLSMDVVDPQRLAVDKLRLAKSLRLVADIVPDAQLDAWIKQYQEQGEPQWVTPDEHANDSEKRQKVAEERRQQHDALCERVDALKRSEAARRVLGPDGVNLLNLVAARHRMELMGFAREPRDATPDDLDALFGKPADDAMRTDLRLPLERALKQDGEGEGKIVGVVLLTDGQHNVHEPGNLRREPPAKKSIELGEHTLPIFPVALGARVGPPDIALVGLKAQPTVFKDVDLPVEARFKVTGLPAQEIVVELQRPGKPPVEKKIKHDGKDSYHNVTFLVRMEEAGTQSMTVTARPVEQETRPDNNGRPVTVNVADEKARVLMIDGEARWELHYLATVLQRDRAMDPTSVVYLQPRLGRIPEDELLKAGGPRTTLPEGPDALAGYDCIILGDVSPEQLPLADRQRLEKYVADRGGTLVLLAGKRFMPMGYPLQAAAGARPPAGATELDPIQKLLPIEQPRAVTPIKGFPVSLTEEGRLTTFLQMEDEADDSETRWSELPPHYWGVVGKAKPGATPLTFYADPKTEDAKGDKKTQREKDNALIVRHNYGFGRVLFVGLDSTWRWRYKVGDAYHHRFWSQAIRWAASDKPLIAGNESVRFGAPEPVYKQGQAVDVVVRLSEDVRPLAPDAAAGARLLRQEAGGKEEAVALVPLARREAQPRVLEGQVRDLPAGQYAIELVIPELADRLNGPPGADGKPGKLRAGFTVAGPEGEEIIELATNWPLLEEIAAKSGGKVFTPENAAELVELLREKGATKTEHWEFRLWQSWLTLLLFLVVLTVEWVARKFVGLP